ncbi:MAG: hypothetical protein U9R19_11015 [Bacteroidota bacterium]|nr:hypothetical protein [Bacteroidota bacterium]
MRTVTAEEIELYLDELDEMPEEKSEDLVNELSEKQGFIMAYLLAVEHDSFDEYERDGFFYLGLSLWYIMQNLNPEIHVITEEEIEASEHNNFKMLDVMSDETEAGMTKIIELIVENYSQPNLFGYIVEALMEIDEDDEEPIYHPDHSGMMLIYLKTVIDCFDKH